MPIEMSQLENIQTAAPERADADRPAGGWWQAMMARLRKARRRALSRRARRVVLMVIFLWMLNLSDLALTVLAHQIGDFHELNPLARPLLATPTALVVFKLVALSFTTGIFLFYRHYRFTEIGCWILAVVYTGLAVMWLRYYQIFTL